MKTLELRWSFLSYLFLTAPSFCFGCPVSRKSQFLKISRTCWWWHCCHLLTAHLAASKNFSLKQKGQDFPGGPVVKNLPANAGMASIPGPGTKIPRAAGEPSPCTITRACAPQQERPLQWEACTLQPESNPHSPQLEGKKPVCCNKDPAQPKINKLMT